MITGDHDMKPLIIRADASVRIGTGHVMRCLALAQAYQDEGGQVIFAVVDLPASLETRLINEGMRVVWLQHSAGSEADAIATATLAKQHKAKWVVIDGYHFGSDYQHWLKQDDVSVLMLDDYVHAKHYYVDYVLNPNLYADEDMYFRREPNTELLLGVSYSLFRREFRSLKNWTRKINPDAHKILITMGGSDPQNFTVRVLSALQNLKQSNLVVLAVLGGVNYHYQSINPLLENSLFPIKLKFNVLNMLELMLWADIGVTAGGSTTWEMALTGLPFLAIALADNQQRSVQALAERGVCCTLRPKQPIEEEILFQIHSFLHCSESRTHMSQKGRCLYDGLGAIRVVSQIQNIRR